MLVRVDDELLVGRTLEWLHGRSENVWLGSTFPRHWIFMFHRRWGSGLAARKEDPSLRLRGWTYNLHIGLSAGRKTLVLSERILPNKKLLRCVEASAIVCNVQRRCVLKSLPHHTAQTVRSTAQSTAHRPHHTHVQHSVYGQHTVHKPQCTTHRPHPTADIPCNRGKYQGFFSSHVTRKHNACKHWRYYINSTACTTMLQIAYDWSANNT